MNGDWLGEEVGGVCLGYLFVGILILFNVLVFVLVLSVSFFFWIWVFIVYSGSLVDGMVEDWVEGRGNGFLFGV